MSEDKAAPSGMLQPGQVIRPQMTEKTAKTLVENLYGLTVKSIKELNSYDDKNYLVMAEPESRNPHVAEVCPDGYVLKVLNSMDSRETHVEAEHQILNILLKNGFNVPIPTLNMHGKDLSHEKIYYAETTSDNIAENNNPTEEAPHGIHIVRLLTFIPGKIFHQTPYLPRQFFDAGQYVGRCDRVLKGFSHGSLTYPTMWDLRSVPKLKDFVYAVTDDSRRQLISKVLRAYNAEVVPAMDTLPRGVIHGDFNEQNIIVQEKPGQDGKRDEEKEYLISGVIDFGDARDTHYIFEVAIVIMYMMVESKVVDPLEVGGHVLAGYLTEMELSDQEWSVLKVCVAGRYAQSLVMGAYTYMQDPGNEYVLVTATLR